MTTPTYSSGTSIASRSTGSQVLPSISRVSDLRLAGGQLEALAAHQLEQDDELQLAAALDLPGVGALGVADPDRDVADQLLVEAGADLARGQLRRRRGRRAARC